MMLKHLKRRLTPQALPFAMLAGLAATLMIVASGCLPPAPAELAGEVPDGVSGGVSGEVDATDYAAFEPEPTPTPTRRPRRRPIARPTSRTTKPEPKPKPTASPLPSVPLPSTMAGLTFTVYYTAVESFHTGALTPVTGCLELECQASGDIGAYPADFVQAVMDEGTGRITSGAHAGRYLNWSYDVGYWLDTAPRDARGERLVPWVSAAADLEVLDFGVEFKVTACGQGATSGVCRLFKAGDWQVFDRFTPGLGGPGHLDLYIGEEDVADFIETSPKYATTYGAAIALVPPGPQGADTAGGD